MSSYPFRSARHADEGVLDGLDLVDLVTVRENVKDPENRVKDTDNLHAITLFRDIDEGRNVVEYDSNRLEYLQPF